MPRPPRLAAGNIVYHVMNRSHARRSIFENDGDYFSFLKVLKEAKELIPIRVLAFCIMPNHWHMILYPYYDGDLITFVKWLTATHAQRWHLFRGSVGTGHLYQSRYKSFPVFTEEYFLQVCRYVERNALRAGLVPKAQDWKWSSAFTRTKTVGQWHQLLSPWPHEIPKNYLRWINQPQYHEEVERIRTTLTPKIGRPRKGV